MGSEPRPGMRCQPWTGGGMEARRRGHKREGGAEGSRSGLTRARAVVCRRGDSGEVEVENELGGGSAQAQREEEKWRRRCSENRRRHLPFIGVVGWCGDAVVHE
jgi:hypothetical protein